MNKILITMGLCALMAGCTTNPVDSRTADLVPASRLLFKSPLDADAKIQVTRDGGALGSACYLGVFLDGALAARIDSSETVTLPVKSGEHLVGMASDPRGSGLCSLGMSLIEVPAVVKPGEHRKYRIFGDMNGGFSISPTSL